MRSWPSPFIPDIPGHGPAVRVHDTARCELVTLEPGPVAGLYVCGITPYDATHMGHAATYVTFDVLGREMCIRDRLKFVAGHKLTAFVLYRVVLGALIVVALGAGWLTAQ